MIAAAAALFASYFFRVAWVLDDEERHRTKSGPTQPDLRPPA
jgi:hypothetical protein